MNKIDIALIKPQLKVLIFDFDETLYYSPNALNCYINFIKNAILALSDYTEAQALEIMDKYGFTTRGENRVSFGKTCESFGISKADWDKYRIDTFFEIDYENASTVSNKLLEKVGKKYDLYIVSNEIYENLLIKAQKLNIDLSNFKRVYAPKKAENISINKRAVYQEILETNVITSAQAIAIGDRHKVDIKPLEELGGVGVQISNTAQVENLLRELL